MPHRIRPWLDRLRRQNRVHRQDCLQVLKCPVQITNVPALLHLKHVLLHRDNQIVIYQGELDNYELSEQKVFSTEFEQDKILLAAE